MIQISILNRFRHLGLSKDILHKTCIVKLPVSAKIWLWLDKTTGLFATTILENIVYGAGDPDDGDSMQEMCEILSTLHAGDVIQAKHRHTVDGVLKASE